MLTARALADRLPVTAAALAAGDVSIEHAGVLARATETLPEPVLARAEGLLVDTAREWDPAVTARAGARVRHVLDTGGEDEQAGREHAARRLHVSRTFAGMVAVDGLLEPAAGEVVLTALQALSTPQPGDSRTPGQRRADAFEEMSRRVLDSGQLAECGGERPHVTVTVDLATLQARPGASPAEATWVGPLRGEDARRLACDAGVSRVLTNGPSEVLDVGRRTRTVSPALRRALVVRDGGCVYAGCDRPPQWTDAHHIEHWADGGPTCLPNLCLLCRHHHRAVHQHGLHIRINERGKVKVDKPSTSSRAGP